MYPIYTNIEGYVASLENISRDADLVIVELSNTELKLIGQLLHIYLLNNPTSRIGTKLLEALATQCDSIKYDPTLHRVYPANKAPFLAVKTEGAWIVPFEEIKHVDD